MLRKDNPILITDLLNLDIKQVKESRVLIEKGIYQGVLVLDNNNATAVIEFKMFEVLNKSYCLFKIEKYEFKVNLREKESNLKKGKILYFVCPETNRFCRKLYKMPNELKWCSIHAFKQRIYYANQICSKLSRYSVSYFKISEQLRQYNNIEITRNGTLTKKARRKRLLEIKRDLMYLCMISPVANPKLKPFFSENIVIRIKALLKDLG